VESRIKDNGGRRFGTERREFSYTVHVPERREGEDRRNGFDRRNRFNQRSSIHGRRHMDVAWNVRIFYESLSLKGGNC
jgi:hypothetical protein